MTDDFLDHKLSKREQNNSLRSLHIKKEDLVDFCSNDYLGVVRSRLIEKSATPNLPHGSTGSRLLSGNYPLIEATEKLIAGFHQAASGLIYNSGYDANTGLISSVPQKDDLILYDQLSHASIRDGIRLSFASAHSFLHNDPEDLESRLKAAGGHRQKFVVTESVFSMDGDLAPLIPISLLCEKYNAALIVDEAHATGVIGTKGEGLVQQMNLQKKCFARIHTFGKACGAHGAIILGSEKLKKYLINFSRQLIYSTSLPPASVEAIKISYDCFPAMDKQRERINELVAIFQGSALSYQILKSQTPIQVIIIPGNEQVKRIARICRDKNFDIRPILYPTVPLGQERLRIVLHAFNTIEQVHGLINVLNSNATQP